MPHLFAKTRLLEAKIDEYLDHTSEVGLLFVEAMKDYVDRRHEEFEARRRHVTELERHADDLRKDIERQLYAQTLIPESRGDVLGILEHTDTVINTVKMTLMRVSVERPEIPPDVARGFVELADYGSRSVQELVAGIRAFFRGAPTVTDSVHKVAFWEKEADKIIERLSRDIFQADLDLSRKMHLGDFVSRVGTVSDAAEEVSDRLAISAIKRSI
jgi:predicted phosphate transport protein (TIGR00153 family)